MLPETEAKKRMIVFLEKIADMCDKEATEILKLSEGNPLDLSGFACSQPIMNVYVMCKMTIARANIKD